AVDNSIRCGAGPEAPAAAAAGADPQAPWVMTSFSVMPSIFTPATLIPEKELQVDVMRTTRKLSGFDANGKPRYEETSERRSFYFLEDGTALIPLALPNEREAAAFHIQEALLGIRVKVLGKDSPASWGALSVTSDIDNADILLDGGVVGK